MKILIRPYEVCRMLEPPKNNSTKMMLTMIVFLSKEVKRKYIKGTVVVMALALCFGLPLMLQYEERSSFDFLKQRSLENVSLDDPHLIQIIKDKYLNPPSKEKYNLTSRRNDQSIWQAKYVKKILKAKRNGFFIECGAHDGEFLSNTLLFEKAYGWEGLLIEAFQTNYEVLIQKHRKAWTVPACLSINNYPSENMIKYVWVKDGKLNYQIWTITNDTVEKDVEGLAYKVQCFPLYSILLALNRTQVDYFSLDIEGKELDVLRTIPWDKVEITVISAEFNHVTEGKEALRSYMESKGYVVYIDGANLYTMQNIDYIFYHPEHLRKSLKKRMANF